MKLLVRSETMGDLGLHGIRRVCIPLSARNGGVGSRVEEKTA